MGGGGKGDRKDYRATSAAKAAEALAAKGAAAGGGFGGFSGIRPVAGFGFGAPGAAAAAAGGGGTAAAGGAAAAGGGDGPLELSAQLDGELAQCLRHLGKRDTTTKLKALQALEELLPTKSPADLTAMLPPWAYAFRRLLLDPSKAVRVKAAAVMARLGSAVGKALLPHLRGLLGPWLLACYDPQPDAAAAAKRSLAEVFPGRKQADALAYCRAEVLEHITSCLAATPQTLGDVKKDTPEELEERHERITAASLAAAAALLAPAAAPAADAGGGNGSSSNAAAAGEEDAEGVQAVQDALSAILATPGFFKKTLGSKSPVVRRAAHGLVSAVSARAPQLLHAHLAVAAPAVLAALQDKEPGNHPPMWDMLLTFISAQPAAELWGAVNLQKAVLPRLLSLLRHGCYGSAAASLPALLPLLALLPRPALGLQSALLLDQVVEALWTGQQQQGLLIRGDRAGVAATAAAIQECLAWGLKHAAALAAAGSSAADAPAGAATQQYCEQLLARGHFAVLLQLAFSSSSTESQLASEIAQALLLQQCSAAGSGSDGSTALSAAPVQLQVLLSAVCGALQSALVSACQPAAAAASEGPPVDAPPPSADTVCSRAQQLLDALTDSPATWSAAAAGELAGCCCGVLLPLLQSGQQLPAPAANLLSRLLREHPGCTSCSSSTPAAAAADSAGSAAGGDGSSIAALVRLGVQGCDDGTLSAANAELLLSCVEGSSNPGAAWGQLLELVALQGPTAAAWTFLDLLLQHFTAGSSSTGSSGVSAGGSSWSQPGLDSLACSLLQQLADSGSAGAADAPTPGTRGLTRRQAAAASLLGCCLGANAQQQVLLGSDALESVLASMAQCLEDVQQQQQQQQPPPAAAGVCIAALTKALDSSSHASSDRQPPGNAGLWQQQPELFSQLLLLVWQLSWGSAAEADAGACADASSWLGSDSDSQASSSSDDSESDLDGSSSSSEVGKVHAAGEHLHSHAAAAGHDGGSAPWAGLRASAAWVWSADLLALALEELPQPHAADLIKQQQELLARGLRAAAGAGMAAAVTEGTRWGRRAAVVVEGLGEQPEQQQQLVQELLTAVPGWQRWCSIDQGCHVRADSSSSGPSQPLDAAHMLMVQFSSVLLLQAGCDVLLPLHRGHLLPSARQHADASGASSSAAASTDGSRRWLRLELLCSNSSTSQPQAESPEDQALAGSSTGSLQQCVAAAARSAQHQLLRAAGKGSSGAASAVARSQLQDSLEDLLAAAARTANPSSSSSSSSDAALRVYSSTLQQLLRGTVAALRGSAVARGHLVPVLQEFAARDVAAAAQAYTQEPGASGASVPAVALQDVLRLCAEALRYAGDGEGALVASGFAALSVALMRNAAALPATDAAGSELLQLCVACFPVCSHQQQQEAAAAGASTAAEREALAALLRHVCSGTAAGAGAPAATAAAADAGLQCSLQLCCVSYCWPDLLAPEWHILLRDVQQRLTAARQGVEKAAGGLAGAVCTAAQQLLGSRAVEQPVSAAMAVQLVQRLNQKGLLQQQTELAASLAAAAAQAVAQLAALSVLPSGLQLLAAVLQLQDRVQAAGRAPQLSLALSAAWRELLSLLLALGAAVAVGGCCGAGPASELQQFCASRGDTWALLQQCLAVCAAPDGDAVGNVLGAADDKVEMLGVDAVSCCLALLQQGTPPHSHHGHHQQQQQAHAGGGSGCEQLQQLAWALLVHPASLAGITHAATAGGSSGGAGEEEAGGVPEYGVADDAAAYLVKVGLRPELAAGLVSTRPWQHHLLCWALLLGHISQLPARSAAQRRLCQALREVPELVPQLLDRVVGLMGLGGSSKGGSAAAGAGEPPAQAPGGGAAVGALSTAAQAALSASLQAAGTSGGAAAASPLMLLSGGAGSAGEAGSLWSLGVALRAIGLPHSHGSWRLLAAAVYRGVLCTLPASARVWFSDLRDRSRSSAVEAFTTKHESPALLAAEFVAIRRDAGGSAGEVGGSCSFKVVASPASREVTAVLEIEDGATLELVVKLPAAAPLKAPEVDCKNKVGIKEARLRKWLLSIAVFLRNQNQGVLDGIAMWKANLDKEFAGVEACLICYSVISAANGQLPRIACKQCAVRFHPSCLYKWIRTSGKSACPHCSALL